jgi:hypothetical protein
MRQQRHTGTRVIIATQEPTLSPTLLDLANATFVHRFVSPAWYEVLKEHLAGARKHSYPSGNSLFDTIVSLHTGEALMFCPTALVSAEIDFNGNNNLKSLSDDCVRLKIRERLTIDGGRSIRAAGAATEVPTARVINDVPMHFVKREPPKPGGKFGPKPANGFAPKFSNGFATRNANGAAMSNSFKPPGVSTAPPAPPPAPAPAPPPAPAPAPPPAPAPAPATQPSDLRIPSRESLLVAADRMVGRMLDKTPTTISVETAMSRVAQALHFDHNSITKEYRLEIVREAVVSLGCFACWSLDTDVRVMQRQCHTRLKLTQTTNITW